MSGAPKSPRRRAREFALQGVYHWLLNQSALTAIESQMAEVGGFDKCDRDLFVGLLRGTVTNAAELQVAFAPYIERPLKEISPEQHFTQPPSRYTEASLVKELEELGIGRPSTYAPTVSTIIARGYVSREKKRLYPTELGRMVTGLMIDYFDSIVDTAFTAQMENELDSVEAGDKQWRDVLKEFYPDFEKKLERAENDIEKIVIEDEKSDVICDKCGATMVYKNGRFGRFLACPSFPECRNTQPILTYIGVICPDCGGEILEKTSKKNRKFYGCEKYPECQFVSWEMPVAKPCPECGHYMTIKRRKNDTLLLCSNEACRHHEPFEEEGNEND